jgi:D-alanyl-D-alanine dipeptidase
VSEPTSPSARRVASAVTEIGTQGFAGLLVPPSPDLAYLIGYEPMPLERPTLLVLRADREPVLLVPALEEPLAAASIRADVTIVPWRDGDDPYAAAAGLLPDGGRVAVGDRCWAVHLLGLQRAAPSVAFASASPVLGRLRAVKDDEELAALRRAGTAADGTFDAIREVGFAGRREHEVAADLAALLVRTGHARADFTIVASGPNGASPHHEPGDRTIRHGDAVVLDFGGEFDGYFSDTSRTVVVGEEPEGFREVYEVVREAQDAAVQAVAPGIEIQEVDRVARAVIDAAGYGERFLHRTGHGIGLEVHEPPYAVEGDRTPLEPGMTFSVEPGIYLEGRFGVRIEDIVAVTSDGVERFNRSSRDLQVVT